MQPWIRQVLREARERAGATLKDLEARAGVDRSTLSRYEQGNAVWPNNLDAIVEAYADAAGVRAVDLWQSAVALWLQDERRDTNAATTRARQVVQRARRS